MGKLIGISFPFRKGSDGIPTTDQENDIIKGSIKQILKTRPGERIMEPEFGSFLYTLIFENNDELMAAKVKEEVFRSLSAWEPRIKVLKIDVQTQEEHVIIDVFYEYLSEADDVKIEMDRTVS